MNADLFRTLFDYSYWARDRLLKAADGLSEADYAKPNGFSNYGDLCSILTHQLASEVAYSSRWTGQASEAVTVESLPTVEALAARWQQQEASLRAYLGGLSDADLDRELVTQRRSGGEFRRPLWQDMMQIVNHGTQHRSEAAEALTYIGRSPGNLDFSAYLQEMQPVA